MVGLLHESSENGTFWVPEGLIVKSAADTGQDHGRAIRHRQGRPRAR